MPKPRRKRRSHHIEISAKRGSPPADAHSVRDEPEIDPTGLRPTRPVGRKPLGHEPMRTVLQLRLTTHQRSTIERAVALHNRDENKPLALSTWMRTVIMKVAEKHLSGQPANLHAPVVEESCE